jgi:hypothetical protein
VLSDSSLLTNRNQVTPRVAMKWTGVKEEALQNVVARSEQSNSIYSKQNMNETITFIVKTSAFISSINPESSVFS